VGQGGYFGTGGLQVWDEYRGHASLSGGPDAQFRILQNNTRVRGNPKALCSEQEQIRRWLAVCHLIPTTQDGKIRR
jgi:hypothetical protein